MVLFCFSRIDQLAGSGRTFFRKRCYFEWYYHAHGTDADFDPNEAMTLNDEARLRLRNAPVLLFLAHCDDGSCPTEWQRSQVPKAWAEWLDVGHDGIDTGYFIPNPGARLVLPRLGLDLSHVSELVTYVSRGFEPYRGFPQFIAALERVLRERPRCHAVIVGEDRVAYGKRLPGGETYKERLLKKYPLDPARVHFTGPLPYGEYVKCSKLPPRMSTSPAPLSSRGPCWKRCPPAALSSAPQPRRCKRSSERVRMECSPISSMCPRSRGASSGP